MIHYDDRVKKWDSINWNLFFFQKKIEKKKQTNRLHQ